MGQLLPDAMLLAYYRSVKYQAGQLPKGRSLSRTSVWYGRSFRVAGQTAEASEDSSTIHPVNRAGQALSAFLAIATY
jgi:hypothetical protein